MDLRSSLLRLASMKPETRRHLIPLLRRDWAIRMSTEFPTEDALKKYLEEHPDADPKNHSVSGGGEGGNKEEAPKGLKNRLKSLFSKVKNAKKEIVEALKKAPAQVQEIMVDPEKRKAALSSIAQGIKKSPKAIAKTIIKSATSELKELRHAAGTTKKFLKIPPGPFSKEDKKALYSSGAYIAGAALAAIPPGGLVLAAGALGHSFALHVGIKAVHAVLDQGFLHFEWAESLFHATHFLASRKAQDEPDDKTVEAFTEAMTRVVADILEKGLSDSEMQEILKGVELPEVTD